MPRALPLSSLTSTLVKGNNLTAITIDKLICKPPGISHINHHPVKLWRIVTFYAISMPQQCCVIHGQSLSYPSRRNNAWFRPPLTLLRSDTCHAHMASA